MFGDKLFPMLGMQPPDMYEQVQDKKFAVGQYSYTKCTSACLRKASYLLSTFALLGHAHLPGYTHDSYRALYLSWVGVARELLQDCATS